MRMVLGALAVCVVLPIVPARAENQVLGPVLQPARILSVIGKLVDDDGELAKDMSGIACLPSIQDGKPRSCIAINDQDAHGQVVSLSDGTLTAGPRFRLLPEQASSAILGAAPTGLACSEGPAKFKDLDGEAVAFAAPYFYIVGSHGCSRHGNKFRASSFVLARVRVDSGGWGVSADGAPQTTPAGALQNVSMTFRLSDALRRADGLTGYFGQNLHRDDRIGAAGNGLNVEGLAVVSGTLYAGLRAPSLGGKAFIVGVPVEPLFAPGNAAMTVQPTVLPFELGKEVGIRDLAPLPDGRLLVLAGPAQEQEDVAYSLHAVELRPGGGAEFLATLAPVLGSDSRPGKAEAVLPLGREADKLRVLVLFDSLPNGGPREYLVPIR